MRLTDLFLWFILYSIVGWVWESLLFTVQERRFVNRGFLNGPLCPVYGFGALLLILVLQGRTDNTALLFIISLVLTTTLEYLTAVIMENLFHAKWWDYSMYPLNYKGRISVLSSLVFAVMATLQLKHGHPFVVRVTGRIPENAKLYILFAVSVFLLFDVVVTIRHVFILNGRLKEIQTALNSFIGVSLKRRAGEVRQSILATFEESEFYSERIKALFKLDRLQNARLLRAFPRLRSLKYDDALKKLKERLLPRKEPADPGGAAGKDPSDAQDKADG